MVHSKIELAIKVLDAEGELNNDIGMTMTEHFQSALIEP